MYGIGNYGMMIVLLFGYSALRGVEGLRQAVEGLAQDVGVDSKGERRESPVKTGRKTA